MYGIINKSLESLIKENYGELYWIKIKKLSRINEEYFVSNEIYNDDITYSIAKNTAKITNTPIENIFMTFGEYWILQTCKSKYGSLMEAGGDNLKSFLKNLPAFHDRIMLYYPKITPPEFKTSHEENNSICIHYFSKRVGLKDFVRGLFQGLGKLYNVPVTIDLIEDRDNGDNHEIFKISW